MERHVISRIHSLLSEAARTDDEFVLYPEIVRMAGLDHLFGDAASGALGHLLYEVNEYDLSQDASRPMLSAVAVSKETTTPSVGFYRLAQDYGKLRSSSPGEDLEFWLHELQTLREYWRSRSETVFLGVSVSFDAVKKALQEFDAEYEDTNDFAHWLEDPRYKYIVEYAGRIYPPKRIIRAVTGIDIGFSGGDQSNHMFTRLGLSVTDKPAFKHRVGSNVRPAYLLTWNPRNFAWEGFEDDWDAVYMGFRPRFRWSCGNTKRIAVGDRVFMMRLGWREQVTGIFASGWVTKEPFVDKHWSEEKQGSTALYVEFEPDVLLNPDTGELLKPDTVAADYNWYPQSSGVTIPQAIVESLERAWQQHIQRSGVKTIAPREQGPQETQEQLYKEGARILVSGYRYERDPHAREACIRHHGTSCAVCGFNFGEEFGAVGDGFIHVHHLTLISDRGSEYVIDPIEDLRPVCPNCHAMLHRKSPPYSIDELKVVRQRAAE